MAMTTTVRMICYRDTVALSYYNMRYNWLHPYGIAYIDLHWNSIFLQEHMLQTMPSEFKRKYKLRMKLVRP